MREMCTCGSHGCAVGLLANGARWVDREIGICGPSTRQKGQIPRPRMLSSCTAKPNYFVSSFGNENGFDVSHRPDRLQFWYGFPRVVHCSCESRWRDPVRRFERTISRGTIDRAMSHVGSGDSRSKLGRAGRIIEVK